MIGRLNIAHKQATVVGAGIAGMAAAYMLDKKGFEVTLLEASERAGGLIRTRQTEFGIAESAAHSLIVTDAVRELCLDLDVALVEPRKESKAKFILRDGKLRRFPLTMKESLSTLLHTSFARAVNANEDLEVWARRHLGKPALDYLLTPFVRGIYGVQPAELGVASAFPFLNLQPGKTLLGTVLNKRRKSGKKATKKRAAPKFGMGDLVGRLERRLEQRLGARFRKGQRVSGIPDAPNVILATPAYTAATILDSDWPALANKLRAVRYTPLVSVTVFVDRNALSRPLHGVGVLMPAREETKSLGILFNSSSFECRVSDESRFASFTVMMGGTSNSQLLSASDDEIRQAIKLEFWALLGIREPLATVIHRWPAALPQYSVELPELWQCASESWCAQPGRILTGNYTGDISLRGMIDKAAALGCP
jgi:oxygen-dependent protoporphyrinogen oxidase